MRWNKLLIDEAGKWNQSMIDIYQRMDEKQVRRYFKLNSLLGDKKLFPSVYPFTDQGFRKPGIPYEYNEWEQDKIDNWKSIDTYKDISFQLRDNQLDMVRNLTKYQYNIFNVGRQLGTTYTYLIFIIKHLIENPGTAAILICNNIGQATNNSSRVRRLIKSMPFGLQPGIVSCNQKNIRFENGSRIKFVSTWQHVIGSTWDLVIIDSFAFSTANKKQKFVESILPGLRASSTSRLLICSVPNGFEMFQEIFTNKDNKYSFFNRQEYPSNKHKKHYGLIGDLEIQQEYNCKFIKKDKHYHDVSL